jgi:hypothetical protein
MPPEVLVLQAEMLTTGKMCAFWQVEDARKDFVQFRSAITPKWSCYTSAVLPASDLFMSSAPWQTIWEEKMIDSTALVIATQVSWFNLYCTLYELYFNYVSKEFLSTQ